MKRVGAMRTRAYASGNPVSDRPVPRAHGPGCARRCSRCWSSRPTASQRLRPALAAQGVRLAAWAELTEAQRREACEYFDSHVSPALTPLSLDPSNPFPFMSNLSTSWGFVLRDPAAAEPVHVRVKVPPTMPHWVPLRADVPAGAALLRRPAGPRAPQRAQALPRRRDRARDAVPRLAQRRHRDRGRHRQQHQGARRGAGAAAALPAGRPPRVRRVAAPRDPRRAHGAVRAARQRRLRARRAARLHDAVRDRLAADPGAARPAVGADGAAGARRGSRPVRRDPRGRRAGPSPVRELRRDRRALHPRCRRTTRASRRSR